VITLTSFLQSLEISVFSIVIVFVILYLVTISVELLKKTQKTIIEQPVITPEPAIQSIDQITDEDMMVAALVASIDYREQTKTNVRVRSIKEIK
jgi:glutaconyl-CoA/methylmalonyl-CoA decarboxylase subunit delta